MSSSVVEGIENKSNGKPGSFVLLLLGVKVLRVLVFLYVFDSFRSAGGGGNGFK